MRSGVAIAVRESDDEPSIPLAMITVETPARVSEEASSSALDLAPTRPLPNAR